MSNIKEKLVHEIINPTKISDLVKYDAPSNLLLAGNDKTILYDQNLFVDGIQRTSIIKEYKNGSMKI